MCQTLHWYQTKLNFPNKLEFKYYCILEVVPCSMVDIYQHFGGNCCFHPQGRRENSSGWNSWWNREERARIEQEWGKLNGNLWHWKGLNMHQMSHHSQLLEQTLPVPDFNKIEHWGHCSDDSAVNICALLKFCLWWLSWLRCLWYSSVLPDKC